MQLHDTLSGFESKIYRKDGTIIWIAENCRAVRDPRGRLLYYEGTVEDISERKRAEEQIRRATSELSRSREELRAKNLVMEENLRTAREIQLAMLPQQYPGFPAGADPAESAFQFVHRYQPAEAVSGDFFSISALSDEEAGVFICDVTGPRGARGAGDGHDPGAGGGAQAAGAGSGPVPAQIEFGFVQHPQEHRGADADDRLLPGGQLPDGVAALRQRRPSQTTGGTPQPGPGGAAGQ
jgi:hypothetical protein